MLVMQEPMNTSSILSPATSDSGLTSSGSFGQASDRLLDLGQIDLDHRGIFGVGVGLPAGPGLASQASIAAMRRSRVRRS